MTKDLHPLNLLLFNKKVGISVSESEAPAGSGISKRRQADMTTELAKYLLINGAHLIYGGDTRSDGYTPLFAKLATEFGNINVKKPFTNYLAWPVHLAKITNDDLMRWDPELIEVPAHDIVPEDQRKDTEFSNYRDARYFQAASLSKMRERMIKNADAQVLIGGKLSEYSGFFPGILEEAAIAIRHNKPIYISGAMNGASAFVIRAIKGENSADLQEELMEHYPELHELYDDKSHRGRAALKLSLMLKSFKDLGVKGLSRLNMLSEKENETLFNSPHFHEILYHNLIGLKRAL